MFPKYTVITNIVSPEKPGFTGTCWEFFTDEGHASLCYQRQLKAGNVPTLRKFHHTDIERMGVVDQRNLLGNV